ncbi:hypothetical protein [Streptomyces sp. NPDC020983]|uniref:hypothetical protein n=1 Tax=Streptomyces sp. NPDC020983 TaxID=3365106 RepID=UPI00379AE18D
MGTGGRERGSREVMTFPQRLRMVLRDPRIVAKTVALTGVLALSGRLLLPDGRQLAFVAFLGGPLLALLTARDVARVRERHAKARRWDRGSA